MTRLFICEKPSQGRDIARVIGANRKADGYLASDNVIVTWAYGHLLEQAPPDAYDDQLKRWSLETLPIRPSHWKNTVKKSAMKQFKVIKSLLQRAEEVVIATDADREGETIGRELLEACNYRGAIYRLWLSALNDASIKKALTDLRPGDSTYSLYQAGLGRARADWLVGMNMTRALTVLAQQQGHEGVLSVGRVQTPTLAIVVQRDREIENFVPKPFWDVTAELKTVEGEVFNAKWRPSHDSWVDEHGRCTNRDWAYAVAANNSTPAIVASVDTERKSEAAPLVLDISMLQQLCSKKFGFGVQQTLDIAQSLYESHKATTYPRTDCRYLPMSMLDEAEQVITALLNSDKSLAPTIKSLDLSIKSRVWNDEKVDAAAHHGIIPTLDPCSVVRMTDDERKVYELIRVHYMAQFMPDHVYDLTRIELMLDKERFSVSGRQIIIDGWKSLFSNQNAADVELENTDSQALPHMDKGAHCDVVKLDVKERQTQPKKHFTQGTLIEVMKKPAPFVHDPRLKTRLRESAGIGTVATRPGVIETLFQRGFLRKKNRHVVSTEIGRGLIDSLPAMVADPGMTALLEQSLDQVAEGSMTLDDFMKRQEFILDKMLNTVLQQTQLNLPEAETESCPLCQSKMRRRNGQNGPFWGCVNYPECTGIKPINTKKVKKSSKSTSRKKKSSV